jgi:hypothetical protein
MGSYERNNEQTSGEASNDTKDLYPFQHDRHGVLVQSRNGTTPFNSSRFRGHRGTVIDYRCAQGCQIESYFLIESKVFAHIESNRMQIELNEIFDF